MFNSVSAEEELKQREFEDSNDKKKQTLQRAAAEKVRSSWFKAELVNFQINSVEIGLWLQVITCIFTKTLSSGRFLRLG